MAFRPDDWTAILAALRNVDDIDGVVAAGENLHRHATPEDVPRLRELLRDPDAPVREAAAWPLSVLAGPTLLRELFVAYQRGFDEGLDNDGFTAALIDLASADGSADVLRQLAEDNAPDIRENALWLLDFCEPNA